VDAAPFLVERARAADPTRDGLWLMEDLRRFVDLRAPGTVLMGEADVEVDEYADYFGDDDRLNMLLDFWKSSHLFAALAQEDAEPLRRAIVKQPGPPSLASYAVFARNHDELDLERLTKDEREQVLEAFAPDPDMRIYGKGIRRRLAPMLGGDVRRLTMAHALQLSLPGTPVLLYGDEIGIGEDLSRDGRSSVRLPMQWSGESSGGFSTAPENKLVVPAVRGGRFGYEKVNVSAQASEAGSLLNRVDGLIRARLDAVEIGDGTCEVVDVGASSVLCLSYSDDGSTLITAVNLSPDRVECRLPDELAGDLVDLVTDGGSPSVPGPEGGFRLDGYGYRWCRRQEEVVQW
jgi:maltose alpha-D-glucosyltransferase / alpha-amylase